MSEIRLLSPDLINKIAAGEVVERPASIVKELIENSLDAEAKSIKIIIEQGGINFIQVIDDGNGMDEQDAKLAMVLHATSKIVQMDDLTNINTLGFRGEALASISSVAQTSLHTKRNESEAVFVEAINSKINVKVGEARKTGTTVTVKNIFQNIPARKKFLKSEATEYRAILIIFIKLALANYHINFNLVHNNKNVYNLLGCSSYEERILQIYPQLKNNLIHLYYSDPVFNISGFIGHPSKNRRDSSIQYIQINNRPIHEPLINKAIKTGFGTNLMHNQQPVYFIQINLDPQKVDVNVHPRKETVRFDNSQEVFKIIYKTVRKALETTLQEDLRRKFPKPIEPFVTPVKKDIKTQQQHLQSVSKKSDYSIQQGLAFTKELLQKNISNYQPSQTQDVIKVLQVWKTYLIVEHEQELMIIDQHAAAERITFEKISERFKQDSSLSSQELLIPEIIQVSKQEQVKIAAHITTIKKLGFNISFKGNSLQINSIPNILIKNQLHEAFSELISELSTFSDSINKEETKLMHKIISTIACHSSIRAGEKLTLENAQQIVRDLLKCQQPYSCPHGRPIIWSLTRNQLEKNFKRKL